MPYKDPKKQKAAQHAFYLRNRDAIKERQAERKEIRNQNAVERRRSLCRWINDLKEGQPCVDCGIVYPPWACDFHHLDPDTKRSGIRRMANLGFSKKEILKEMEKCDYLCVICHRGRHYDPSWKMMWTSNLGERARLLIENKLGSNPRSTA